MGRISEVVAKMTTSETAQRVIALDPALAAGPLRQNSFLSDAVFAQLYVKKLPVAEAKDLVSVNVPTDGQFAHVLAVETRGTVLVHMLELGTPALDRLDALADAKGMNRALADKIVTHHNAALSLDWLRKVAAKVGSKARVELWLRAPHEFTDEEISDALQCHSAWGTTTPDKGRIKELLASRPGVIAGAARSDTPKVRTVVAGCRHLLDRDLQIACAHLDQDYDSWLQVNEWVLIALANNPVVGNDVVQLCGKALADSDEWSHRESAANRLMRHPSPVTEPYDEVSSPVLLGWLLNRCLPFENGDGRLHDLPSLLANPNLGVPEAQLVQRKLGKDARPAAVAQAYNALSARLPDAGIGTLEALDPAPEWAQRLEPDALESDTELEEVAGRVSPAGIVYYPDALRYMERQLADNADAWRFALRLADEGLTGNVIDLVTVTKATYM